MRRQSVGYLLHPFRRLTSKKQSMVSLELIEILVTCSTRILETMCFIHDQVVKLELPQEASIKGLFAAKVAVSRQNDVQLFRRITAPPRQILSETRP
jgi:hypothetical protein